MYTGKESRQDHLLGVGHASGHSGRLPRQPFILGGNEVAISNTCSERHTRLRSQHQLLGLEFEIQGIVNPITGTDYAPKAADWLNTKWREGYFKQSGELLRPWPEYPNRIAWGSKGKLIIRWVKMQPWAYILVPVVFAALAVLFYIGWPVIEWLKWFFRRLIPIPPPPEDPCEEFKGKAIAYWWCKASPIEKASEKASIIGAFTMVGCFGLWFLIERSIAEAGAPKIIVGGTVG